jgi:hypothetical protein
VSRGAVIVAFVALALPIATSGASPRPSAGPGGPSTGTTSPVPSPLLTPPAWIPVPEASPGLAGPAPTWIPAPLPTPNLDTPSGGGAAAPLPSDVLGAWYTGTVGNVQYYDPITGGWADTSGTGSSYTFKADGTFEFAFLETSSLYSCTMRILGYRAGPAVADSTVPALVLRDATHVLHSEDTCVAEWNYDKELELGFEVLYWQRGSDEYGELLWLRRLDTDWSAFRPME